MEFTLKRTVQIISILLIAAAATQAFYTILAANEMAVPRQFIWGLEAVIFVLLAAFAGSALGGARRYSLGFSAITLAATLNVVQVGVGLTMFGPFRDVAASADAFAPAAGAVVAFSFMVYNAAKILIGLAAIVFGMAKLNTGSKILGGLTVFAGGAAMVTNALSMTAGRGFSGDLPLAGGFGVLATILLALCIWGAAKAD